MFVRRDSIDCGVAGDGGAVAGCDGVGNPDGSAQLWSAEERVLFIQHAQVSHVPTTLIGVEINEKMVGILMAGAASTVVAFWDHTNNRGFEGFAFDRPA